MVISIIGASGFIGSNLCKSLGKLYTIKKWDVRDIDLFSKEEKLMNFFIRKHM